MMKAKKKSKFVTFCFSLLPGAAEMYMGFMKMGVSLMSLFFLIIMLGMLMNQGIIVMAGIVVWFYGFFHIIRATNSYPRSLIISAPEFQSIQTPKRINTAAIQLWYFFTKDVIPGISSIPNRYLSSICPNTSSSCAAR